MTGGNRGALCLLWRWAFCNRWRQGCPVLVVEMVFCDRWRQGSPVLVVEMVSYDWCGDRVPCAYCGDGCSMTGGDRGAMCFLWRSVFCDRQGDWGALHMVWVTDAEVMFCILHGDKTTLLSV